MPFLSTTQKQTKQQQSSQPGNHSAATMTPPTYGVQLIDQSSKAEKDAPIQRKPNKTGLPDSLKTGLEHLSGYSMEDVRVHANSSKPAQLHAHAYAQGTNIYLGPGKEQHLPHEAWHVVQQKQGRVKSTMQTKGGVKINDDRGLEREASMMGSKALHIQGNVNSTSTENIRSSSASGIGQVAQLDRISKDFGNYRVISNDEEKVDLRMAFLESKNHPQAPVHLSKNIKDTGVDFIKSDDNSTLNNLNTHNTANPDFHFTLTSGFMTSVLTSSKIKKYLVNYGKASEIWNHWDITNEKLSQDKKKANEIVEGFNKDLGVQAGNKFDNLFFTFDPDGKGLSLKRVIELHDEIHNSLKHLPNPKNPHKVKEYPFTSVNYRHMANQVKQGATSLIQQWNTWVGQNKIDNQINDQDQLLPLFKMPGDKESDLTKAGKIISKMVKKAKELEQSEYKFSSSSISKWIENEKKVKKKNQK